MNEVSFVADYLFPGDNDVSTKTDDDVMDQIRWHYDQMKQLHDERSETEYMRQAFKYFWLNYDTSSSTDDMDEQASSEQPLLVFAEGTTWIEDDDIFERLQLDLASSMKGKQFKPGENPLADFDLAARLRSKQWAQIQLFLRCTERWWNIETGDFLPDAHECTEQINYFLKMKDRLTGYLEERLHNPTHSTVNVGHTNRFVTSKLQYRYSALDMSSTVLHHLRTRMKQEQICIQDGFIYRAEMVNPNKKPKRLKIPVLSEKQLRKGDSVLIFDETGSESRQTRYVGQSCYHEIKKGKVLYLEETEEEGVFKHKDWTDCEFRDIEYEDFLQLPVDSQVHIKCGDFVQADVASKVSIDEVELLHGKQLMRVCRDLDGRISLSHVHQATFRLTMNDMICKRCNEGKNFHSPHNEACKCVFKAELVDDEDEGAQTLVSTLFYKQCCTLGQWIAKECNTERPMLNSFWMSKGGDAENLEKKLSTACYRDVERHNPRKYLRSFLNGILDVSDPPTFYQYKCTCGRTPEDCRCELVSAIPRSKHPDFKNEEGSFATSHSSKFFHKWFDTSIIEKESYYGLPNYKARFFSEPHTIMPDYPPYENLEILLDTAKRKMIIDARDEDIGIPLKRATIRKSYRLNSYEIHLRDADGSRMNLSNVYAIISIGGQMRKVLKKGKGGRRRLKRPFGVPMERGTKVYLLMRRIRLEPEQSQLFPWVLAPDATTKEIKTPYVDKIFRDQLTKGNGKERVDRILVALKLIIGYCLNISIDVTPLGCLLYIWGAAKTGKSLFGSFIDNLFPKERIKLLSSNAQSQFALGGTIGSFLLKAYDATPEFFKRYDASQIQEICTLGEITENNKYGLAKTGRPDGMILMLSNVKPGWKEYANALTRRIVSIHFPISPPEFDKQEPPCCGGDSDGEMDLDDEDSSFSDSDDEFDGGSNQDRKIVPDSSLRKKLLTEVPEFLVSCASTYHEYFRRFGKKKGQGEVYPLLEEITGAKRNYFVQQQENISGSLNLLVRFLDKDGSSAVKKKRGAYIRMKEFKDAFRKFCRDEGEAQIPVEYLDFRTNQSLFNMRGIFRRVDKKLWPPRQMVRRDGTQENPKTDTEKEEYLVGVGLTEHFPNEDVDQQMKACDANILELLRQRPQPMTKRKLEEIYETCNQQNIYRLSNL